MTVKLTSQTDLRTDLFFASSRFGDGARTNKEHVLLPEALYPGALPGLR
jgi:hypothetical protein